MSELEPQNPPEPQSPVLDYQLKKAGRVRARRNHAIIGGLCIFLTYPCLVFACVAYELDVNWKEPTNMPFYLILPCSLVSGPNGNPLMYQGVFPLFTGTVINAAFWAAVWVMPALIWQSRE